MDNKEKTPEIEDRKLGRKAIGPRCRQSNREREIKIKVRKPKKKKKYLKASARKDIEKEIKRRTKLNINGK